MIKNSFDVIIIIFFLSQVFYMFFLNNKLNEKFTTIRFSKVYENDKRFKNLEILSNLTKEIELNKNTDTQTPKINFKSRNIIGNFNKENGFLYMQSPSKIILHLNKLEIENSPKIKNIINI